MTKPEILEVVKLMLADWEKAYQSKSFSSVILLDCEDGFCNYLYASISDYENIAILLELQRDLMQFKSIKEAWYENFFITKSFKSLLPRIEHLQRTIARLEKEIANETITS